MIRFQIHHLACRLLCRELAPVPLTPTKSVPPYPRTPPVALSTQEHLRLATLREFAAQIVAMSSTKSNEGVAKVVDELEGVFQGLSKLLVKGDVEAITAYELMTSGLDMSLLLCLSMRKTLQWASVVRV